MAHRVVITLENRVVNNLNLLALFRFSHGSFRWTWVLFLQIGGRELFERIPQVEHFLDPEAHGFVVLVGLDDLLNLGLLLEGRAEGSPDIVVDNFHPSSSRLQVVEVVFL